MLTLPPAIQRDFMASLDTNIPPTENGKYVLTHIETLSGGANQRIRVIIEDEDGKTLMNVPIAFAYSTADFQIISEDFEWNPPLQKMDIVTTEQGYADHIQGSVIKKGQPGGVFVFDEKVPSDVVSGLGMLADHTGVRLVFTKVTPQKDTLSEVVEDLEAQIQDLAYRIQSLENKGRLLG